MNRLKFLYYIFYRFQWSLGNKDIPGFVAKIMISFLLVLNFYTILSYIDILNIVDIESSQQKSTGIIVFIVILCLTFFLFSFGGNSKTIISEFNNKYKNKEYYGNVFVITYSIFSIVALLSSFYLLYLRNNQMI